MDMLDLVCWALKAPIYALLACMGALPACLCAPPPQSLMLAWVHMLESGTRCNIRTFSDRARRYGGMVVVWKRRSLSLRSVSL